MFPELFALTESLSVTSFGFCLGLGVLIAWYLVDDTERHLLTAGISFGALAHILALFWGNDGLPSTLFAAALFWSFSNSEKNFSGAFAALAFFFVLGAHLDGWLFGLPLDSDSPFYAIASLPFVAQFPPGSPAFLSQEHAGLIPAGTVLSLPTFPVAFILLFCLVAVFFFRKRLHVSTALGLFGAALLILLSFRADPFMARGAKLFCVLSLLVALVAFQRRRMQKLGPLPATSP